MALSQQPNRIVASQNWCSCLLESKGLKTGTTTKKGCSLRKTSSRAALLRETKEENTCEYDCICRSQETNWWKNPIFVIVFVTARQYHSICMLGLGFVAALTIILLIHHYRKLEISFTIPEYRTLSPSLIQIPNDQNWVSHMWECFKDILMALYKSLCCIIDPSACSVLEICMKT